MAKPQKEVVDEDQLLKALDDLEDLAKGDDLEDAPTEGGFSTEGEPLSRVAKSKKQSTKLSKMASASDMSSDDDDGESDEKSYSKAVKSDDESEESEDDDSDSDDEDDETEKSFSKALSENETLRKGVEVSEFLREFTAENADALEALEKAITVANRKSEGRISKAFDRQENFNVRLANGVVRIGHMLKSLQETVNLIADQEAPVEKRPRTLRKSELASPPHRGDDGPSVSPAAVQKWLMEKAMKGEIETENVSLGEINGWDIRQLPENLAKAIENDLLQ